MMNKVMEQQEQYLDCNYYLEQHKIGSESVDIYDIWENGGALGDSITPATYNVNYRQFMFFLIVNQIRSRNKPKMISLGSGNAFVEKELHNEGFNIVATDINEKAILLAKRKGLIAYQRNVYELSRELDGKYDLVYADGLFGHMYSEKTEFRKVLDVIRNILTKDGILIISNDASLNGQPVMPHSTVPGFYLFTSQYLTTQIENHGFKINTSISYAYERPLSKERHRIILCARIINH